MVYKSFQCRNVQEMQRSIVKHCTPRSQIMWNVILNSSYTSSYIINVDQNKKRKQSPRMRRRDCNLPLTILVFFTTIIQNANYKLNYQNNPNIKCLLPDIGLLIKNLLGFSRSRDQRLPGSLLPKRKVPGYEVGALLSPRHII